MLNGANAQYSNERERTPGDQRSGKERLVRVILVNKTPKCLSHMLRYLEIRDCCYGIANTYDEARKLIRRKGCDLLVGIAPLPPGTMATLARTLTDHQTSFFWAQPVEEGCWWLPVYLRGELCFGKAALRPNEFVKLLDTLVEEVRHVQAESQPSRQVAATLALAAG